MKRKNRAVRKDAHRERAFAQMSDPLALPYEACCQRCKHRTEPAKRIRCKLDGPNARFRARKSICCAEDFEPRGK